MASEEPGAQLDLFRRRRELRHALVTVETAIAEQTGETAELTKLECLRVDLLAALELTERLLERL